MLSRMNAKVVQRNAVPSIFQRATLCRVVKALDAATVCLRAAILLQKPDAAARAETIAELLQRDWLYLGACLGSHDSNGVAALVAHLQTSLHKTFSDRCVHTFLQSQASFSRYVINNFARKQQPMLDIPRKLCRARLCKSEACNLEGQ